MKFDSEDRQLWFTSDTHYWHKNITYGESIWPSKETTTRRFGTTQAMSRHIVEQINKYVGENDILFHLGDWSFSGIENIWNFRKQLKVKEIHILLGNHDHHIKRNKIIPNCHYNEDGDIVDGQNPFIINGHIDNEFNVDARDLFTSIHEYLDIEVDNTLVPLIHYPMENWNDRFGVAYHLHGHTHGTLPTKKNRLDVGVDNANILLGDYRPFSWEEIKTILK